MSQAGWRYRTRSPKYGRLPRFRLDGVIVLVDVETIRARARDRFVDKTVLRQQEGADLLVLTRTDPVSAEHLAAVRAWLQGRAPGTPQIAAAAALRRVQRRT